MLIISQNIYAQLRAVKSETTAYRHGSYYALIMRKRVQNSSDTATVVTWLSYDEETTGETAIKHHFRSSSDFNLQWMIINETEIVPIPEDDPIMLMAKLAPKECFDYYIVEDGSANEWKTIAWATEEEILKCLKISYPHRIPKRLYCQEKAFVAFPYRGNNRPLKRERMLLRKKLMKKGATR